MKHLPRMTLAVGALTYLGLGAWLLANPDGVSSMGLAADSPAARTELRATYGGLELGLGLFLSWCLAGDLARLRAGLLATALTVGGFGFGRAVGLALDSPPQPIFIVLLAMEVTMTALACVAHALLPAPSRSEPAGHEVTAPL